MIFVAVFHLPLFDQDEPLAFDYIFADPPYSKGLSEQILKALDNKFYSIKPRVSVIVEEKKNVVLPVKPGNLYQADRRVYGDSVFHFYKPVIST